MKDFKIILIIIAALIVGFIIGYLLAVETVSHAAFKVLQQYGYSPDILVKECFNRIGL